MSKDSKIAEKIHIFERDVIFKYQIFNGLFLGLPFQDLDQSGARLSIFSSRCFDGLANGLTPQQIVETYLGRVNIPQSRHFDLLFKFIQFIERQIVLCDSLENATFGNIYDLSGIGTLDYFNNQLTTRNKATITKLKHILDYYKVRLVLTAHPTQFYPKQILSIIDRMTTAIQNNDLEEIHNLFLQMGMTKFNNSIKPTPIEEARSLIWYLENIFYHDMPVIQKKIDAKSSNIELGFWPGGDRDGNLYVTAETTLDVAKKLKQSILRLYYQDLLKLYQRLTFDKIDAKVRVIINNVKSQSYAKPQDLILELETIIIDLKYRFQGLFVDKVQDLIQKIHLFQFYFAKIDIRQNSKIHQQIIHDLFNHNNICDNYKELGDLEKVNLIENYLSNVNTLKHPNSDALKESISTLSAISQIITNNGEGAIERYIISNCNSAASIFEVMLLLNISNHILSQQNLPIITNLEIVPLFETVADLKNSPQIMTFLYQNQHYRGILQKNTQVIMLGFSDGTKDGGYLMANWAIYAAKKHLSYVAFENKIDVVFFDGRGGPASRGGGSNTYDFYKALGNSTDLREIQLTIQGQTISNNFGTHQTAQYNYEQLISSGLNAKLFAGDDENLTHSQEKLIEELANITFTAYYELCHDPLFIPYLEQITPLHYLSHMNVGSRPGKRNTDSSLNLSDLRAISYGSAWVEMKQNILSFYGIGYGINQFIKNNPKQLTQLKHLYRTSLFFKTLMNNAMQGVLSSNFTLTHYLEKDKTFAPLWIKIRNEATLTQKMLLKISGFKTLSQSMHPIQYQSHKLREEIITPLLVIQQYALNAIRHEPDKNKKGTLEKIIMRSLAATINASKNSI